MKSQLLDDHRIIGLSKIKLQNSNPDLPWDIIFIHNTTCTWINIAHLQKHLIVSNDNIQFVESIKRQVDVGFKRRSQ